MRIVHLALLLAACQPSAPTSAEDTDTTADADADTDTDTDADTDADADADADTDTDSDTAVAEGCSALTAAADWAWRGECPGMVTPCTLDVDGCTVAITYPGGMTMGMPDAGSVQGDVVTFSGGGVTGCVGTVSDPDRIDGTCGDGCTFALTR